MSYNMTIAERFERLGASRWVAEGLERKGFTPSLVLGIDHPDPASFVTGEDVADEVIDDTAFELLIEESYPTFDPEVLKRLAECPWPMMFWTTEIFGFPGPINRVCALAEAGVNHKVLDFISWGLQDGQSIMDAIDAEMPPAGRLQPIRARSDTDAIADAEFVLSIDGVEANDAGNAMLAYIALGSERDKAVELHNMWDGVTRDVWPLSLLRFPFGLYQDVVDVEPGQFGRLVDMWLALTLQRLKVVAPSIPDYWTAFAQEHPGWGP